MQLGPTVNERLAAYPITRQQWRLRKLTNAEGNVDSCSEIRRRELGLLVSERTRQRGCYANSPFHNCLPLTTFVWHLKISHSPLQLVSLRSVSPVLAD